MRYLIARVLATAATLLTAGVANADLGDQLFKLLASDGAASDFFGLSVAISGSTGIAGAFGDDDNGPASGSAYLFNVATGVQIAKLLPTDGAADDFFGFAVALEGNIAIVGAFGDDDNGETSGSAYLFDTSTGLQLSKLLPSDGAAGDQFGAGVAINGTTVIIGAAFDDDNGTDSGSAYLFDISDPNNPFELTKLLPDDGAAGDRCSNDVAISGNTAIVGSPGDDDNGNRSGSAYLFNAITGAQIAKLLPDDGAEDDIFGAHVAIAGNIAIVGAWGTDINGADSGSVYLFDSTTGTQIAKLLPDDGAAGDGFGAGVSISGTPGNEVAIIACSGDDDNGKSSGSAYLFDATTCRQIAKLLPTDGAAGDVFSRAVAISGTTGNLVAIVGAMHDDDNGSSSGSAYLFDADPGISPTTLTGFAVETGALLDGGLADLESCDNSYVHTRSGFGSTLADVHNMEMTVSALTAVGVPATIDLTIESRIDEPAGTAQIRMRNWNTSEFDPVGSYAIGNVDQVDVINSIDATNYVSGVGDIDVSIKHIVFVPFLAFTFESFIDHVEIIVQ